MPGYRTLTQLVEQVRRRADMENSSFVTDAEIEQYLKDSWGELYDLLVEAHPEFWVAGTEFTTTAGRSNYRFGTDSLTHAFDPENYEVPSMPAGEFPGLVEPAEPNSFAEVYKVISVSAKFGDRYLPLQPDALPDHPQDSSGGWLNPRNVRYAVISAFPWGEKRLLFRPTPLDVHSVRVLYVPVAPDLTYVAPQFQSGWDEYLVVDAAAKILEKEESDVTHLYVRKAKLEERIRWHMQTTNMDSHGGVRDVTQSDDDWWRRWR